MAARAKEKGDEPPWRAYLDQVFPGYLMPASMRHAIDPQTAARFLERLRTPGKLDLLLRSSLIAGRADALQPFCQQLADLAGKLPSEARVEQRLSDGGFHGRLALRETMAHRLAGSPTRYVTNARKRAFDLPENELVRSVAERLRGIIASLRKDDLLREKHWGGPALACEGELQRLVYRTELRKVPEPPSITAYHEQAARAARHPCYESALEWHLWMKDTLDERDDRRLARLLAEGALQPFDDDSRFELAVLVKLIQDIESYCEEQQPGSWTLERSIVMKNRKDVARFIRAHDGACIEIFYDQAVLPPASEQLGARDLGVRYYFAMSGRLRPDITLRVQSPPAPTRGMIVEIKRTTDNGYLARGYGEALLYRYEYASNLIEWPKAVLVCSCNISGAISRSHEVVAVDWRRWAPRELIAAVVPEPAIA
jgi:hypothetical protein